MFYIFCQTVNQKEMFILHSMFLMNIMINKQELFEATRKLNILLNVVL